MLKNMLDQRLLSQIDTEELTVILLLMKLKLLEFG